MKYIKATLADHWFMGGLLYTAINIVWVLSKFVDVRYNKHHGVTRGMKTLLDALDHLISVLEDTARREHPAAEISVLLYYRGGQTPEFQEDIREWWTEKQAEQITGIRCEELRKLGLAGKITTVHAGGMSHYRPYDFGKLSHGEKP